MAAFPSILVHVDASPASLARLRWAHQLADKLDGTVSALFAVTPADLLHPLAADADYPATTSLREFALERRTRARATFDKAVADGMGRLHWDELTRELPLEAFIQRALYADFVVLGAAPATARAGDDLPPHFVASVILGSGRPCVVVPATYHAGTLARMPLLAWNETPQAARAVTAALPLLQAAVRTHVALWADDDGHDTAEAGAAIESWLRRRAVQATVHGFGNASRQLGTDLLQVASELHNDLLVMGCYGHSRAGRWVLGDASRQVLSGANVPVLMVH